MPPINLPDFAGMALIAERYAVSVLPRYVGEALEELTPVLELLTNDLKRCESCSRRFPSELPDYVADTLRDYEELIPYLKDYGIEGTKSLEDIQNDLTEWLQQRRRGQGPQPALM